MVQWDTFRSGISHVVTVADSAGAAACATGSSAERSEHTDEQPESVVQQQLLQHRAATNCADEDNPGAKRNSAKETVQLYQVTMSQIVSVIVRKAGYKTKTCQN